MSTKYENVASTILTDINAKKFPFGKLPSEEVFVRRFSVSRGTVRKALDELQRKGVIESRKGSGYYLTTGGMHRTNRIGLLMPEITFTPFFHRLAHEVSVFAEKSGISVFLGQEAGGTAAKRTQTVKSVARNFVKQGVDGVIFRPLVDDELQKTNLVVIDILKKAKVPIVLADCDVCHFPGQSGLDVVGINHLDAGRRIAAHLLNCGCRQIVFLQGGPSSVNRHDRLSGVAGEVVAAGARWGVDSVVKLTGGDDEGVETVMKMLEDGATPDAFICGHDAFAVKLMKRLTEAGRRVPEDIHQSARRIAADAVKTLAWRIENPDAKPRRIFVPATLIERGSTDLGHEA